MNLLGLVAFVALFLCVVNGNTVCPGAPLTSYGNGQLNCAKPICLTSGGRLMPSSNPNKYFMCAGHNLSYEMPCPRGTCFSFKRQGCVHTWDWTDECVRPEETKTTTLRPETTTETESEVTTLSPEPEPEITTLPPVTKPETTTPSPVTEPETTTLHPAAEPETTTPAESEPKQPEKVPFTGQVCPGVNPDTVEVGTNECAAPKCNSALKGTKYPDADPKYYYECREGQIYAKTRCVVGCFSVLENKCVDADAWINSCKNK